MSLSFPFLEPATVTIDLDFATPSLEISPLAELRLLLWLVLLANMSGPNENFAQPRLSTSRLKQKRKSRKKFIIYSGGYAYPTVRPAAHERSIFSKLIFICNPNFK
jgi:hypothetical protein